MTNPRTVGEWEAVGFRVVEAGEIDEYPFRFVSPRVAVKVAARLRTARMRHRAPKNPRYPKGGFAYSRAVGAADRRAAIYCHKIGLA
jgi:hypothetical protein